MTGWLFSSLVSPDTWFLCNAVDDSGPPGCGTGVELVAPPAIVTEDPQQLETFDGPDGVPRVVMSRSGVTLEGTFFHDSLLFAPTTSE